MLPVLTVASRLALSNPSATMTAVGGFLTLFWNKLYTKNTKDGYDFNDYSFDFDNTIVAQNEAEINTQISTLKTEIATYQTDINNDVSASVASFVSALPDEKVHVDYTAEDLPAVPNLLDYIKQSNSIALNTNNKIIEQNTIINNNLVALNKLIASSYEVKNKSYTSLESISVTLVETLPALLLALKDISKVSSVIRNASEISVDMQTSQMIQNYDLKTSIDSLKTSIDSLELTSSVTVPENAISITQSTPTVNNTVNVDTTDITTAVNTMKDTNASIDSHLSDIKTSTLSYHTKANTKNEALTDELSFNKNGVDTLKDTTGAVIKPREAKAIHNAEKAIETKEMNLLEILEDDVKSLFSEGAEFLSGITTDGFTDDFADGMNPLNYLFEQVKKAKAKEYKVMQDDGISLAQMKQNLDSLNT